MKDEKYAPTNMPNRIQLHFIKAIHEITRLTYLHPRKTMLSFLKLYTDPLQKGGEGSGKDLYPRHGSRGPARID